MPRELAATEDRAARQAAIPPCSVKNETDGTPFRWLDSDRIMHATVEWPHDPDQPDAPTGMTRCAMYDVGPGESWSGYDELTCVECSKMEATDFAQAGS